MGEITFQMLTKKPAFKPIGQLSSYTRHPETFPSTALSDAGITATGIDFIQSLMKPKPDSRLTTGMALEHIWMQLPSEIMSIPEAKPLQTIEDYLNLTEKHKERIEMQNEVNNSFSGTIRPRRKTSSPRVNIAESTESHNKVKTRGSETMRLRKKTGGVSLKVATVEDYDSIDDLNEFSPLSLGTASDSTESSSEDESVSHKSRAKQSTLVSEEIPRRSEHPRLPEAVSANDPPKRKLSVAERIRALENEKKEKARASRSSKSSKSSSTGNAPRIEIQSVQPSRVTIRGPWPHIEDGK